MYVATLYVHRGMTIQCASGLDMQVSLYYHKLFIHTNIHAPTLTALLDGAQ